MNIREFVGMAVDADVETGGSTPVLAQDVETGMMYSIKCVEVDGGDFDEGNRVDTGPTIFIKIEEM